jgi:chromate reductase
VQDILKVLAISGSTRAGSYNRGLIRATAELAPNFVEIEEYDISDIPFYNGDVEAAGIPAPVLDLVERIRAADAVLIATPEYNYAIPGILKNSVDWVSRPSVMNPLRHKPVAIMGASGGQFGTVRAQLGLRQILASSIEARVMLKPEILVNHAAQKFDLDANLVDEDTRGWIEAFLESFVRWIELVGQRELATA